MKQILFIDLRNSVCGQMAQAWFNQFALNWGEAESCGTMPALLQDPLTMQVMSEVGCDLHQMHPRAVSNRLLARADIVVMMGRNVHADPFAPDVIWDFLDPRVKASFTIAFREMLFAKQCKNSSRTCLARS